MSNLFFELDSHGVVAGVSVGVEARDRGEARETVGSTRKDLRLIVVDARHRNMDAA